MYTIRHGTRPGFVEIIFDGKTTTDVIGELKGYSFKFTQFGGNPRWYGKKENLPPSYQDKSILHAASTDDIVVVTPDSDHRFRTDAAPAELQRIERKPSKTPEPSDHMVKIEKLRMLCERDSNLASYNDALKTCTQETADRYKPDGEFFAKFKIKIGRKYCNVDVATGSGALMVDMTTQEIFGIKGYGVVHKGKAYGTLDTVENWNWFLTGGRTPFEKKDEPVAKSKPLDLKAAKGGHMLSGQVRNIETLEFRADHAFGVNVSKKDSPYCTDGFVMMVRAAVDTDFPHMDRIMANDGRTIEDARLQPVFEKAPLTGIPAAGGVLAFAFDDVAVVARDGKYLTYFEAGERANVFDAEMIRFIQKATRYDEVHLNEKNIAIFLKNKEVVAILLGMDLREHIRLMKEMEKTAPPLSYMVGCKTNKNETKWATNAMRYATKELAEAAGRDLHSRWMALAEWCVLPSFDPVYPKPEPVEFIAPDIVEVAKVMGKLEVVVVKDKTPEEIAWAEFIKNTRKLKGWIGEQQMSCLKDGARGEEKEFFYETANRLVATIAAMPKTYETDKSSKDAVIHLHYFKGGADWWILEKDKGSPDDTPEQFQSQAFGQACLGQGYGDGELGYISIAELIQNNVELDFHWKPITLKELLAKRNPEESPAPEREPEPTPPEPEPVTEHVPFVPRIVDREKREDEIVKNAIDGLKEIQRVGEEKRRALDASREKLPLRVHGEPDEGDEARLAWIKKMRADCTDLRVAESGMTLVK